VPNEMHPRIALFLPSLEGGGAERAFVELANQLVYLGVRVDLVLVRVKGPYLSELRNEVRVVDLRSSRTSFAVIKLFKYIRQNGPDIVLSGLDNANIASMIACMLAGCSKRAVLTQRAMLSECWRLQHPYTHRICLFIIRLLYARARLIVSNSYAASDDLQKEFGIPQSRLAVIHNSVDLARIQRLALEEPGHPWLASPEKSLILSVGSLTTRKDYPTILRALSIVRASRECKLIVLGEGSEREKLERLARELAIEDAVQFLGFDPNPFRWMSRARMLVSASLAEGCPNVIQQALACGTQVVATDCPGGSKEILEGGKWGRLVPIRDPQAMAEAIERTFDDRNPPNGSERAIKFKPSRNAKEYLRVLAKVYSTETP